MATSSKMKEVHGLEWNADMSYQGNDSYSPFFRVRGIEYNFRFYCDGTDFCVALECPDEASRSRFSSFDVLSYVQLNTKGSLEEVYGLATLSTNIKGPMLYINYSRLSSRFNLDIRKRHTFKFLFIFDSADEPKILDNIAVKSVQTAAYPNTSFEFQTLSRDLSRMLEDSSSADVELVCQDRTFTAHRCLLCVRSDVFRAMLSSDMSEGKTGKVQIEDVEAVIFQQFLEYLYKGKLEELTVDAAMQLYKMGDRYAVEALKEECVSYMSENLSQRNICGILSLADCHNDGDLKEIAISYIMSLKDSR